MKKDRITRNKSGWIIIRCGGEEKSLIEWLEDPRVTISGTQLRRRVREVEAGAMHMTVERLLFLPVKRSGCKAITSATASPYFNRQVGNPESNGERWYPSDSEKQKGARMRKIEAIREIMDLRDTLVEVWEE